MDGNSTRTEEITPEGEKKLVVMIEAKAGVPDSDYVKNAFYDCSDI